MNRFGWFSAVAQILLLIGNDQTVRVQSHVFVFWAWSWKQAHRKALRRGKMEEDEYPNCLGEPVRFRLIKIEFLDCLGPLLCGNRKVHIEPGLFRKVTDYSSPLHPELLYPGHTGV